MKYTPTHLIECQVHALGPQQERGEFLSCAPPYFLVRFLGHCLEMYIMSQFLVILCASIYVCLVLICCMYMPLEEVLQNVGMAFSVDTKYHYNLQVGPQISTSIFSKPKAIPAVKKKCN